MQVLHIANVIIVGSGYSLRVNPVVPPEGIMCATSVALGFLLIISWRSVWATPLSIRPSRLAVNPPFPSSARTEMTLPKLLVFLLHLSEKRDIINLPIPVGYNPGLCLGEKCQVAYLQLPVPGNQEDRNAPDFLKSKIRVNIFSPIWKLNRTESPSSIPDSSVPWLSGPPYYGVRNR